MRANRLIGRRGYGPQLILTMVPLLAPLLALRDHMPIIPSPREDRGGKSWRPVLFGLGATVGFAIALGRTRNVQAPGLAPSGPPHSGGGSGVPGRVESALGRSIHLPSPLKDSIEAELSTDGLVLYSPPDAFDSIGTEGVDPDSEATEPREMVDNATDGAPHE